MLRRIRATRHGKESISNDIKKENGERKAMLEKDLKKEFLKRKIEEFFKSLEEEIEETEEEEVEEGQETNLVVIITDEGTRIEGVGDETTLLNGIIGLARVLEEEHGIGFEKISEVLKVTKLFKELQGLK